MEPSLRPITQGFTQSFKIGRTGIAFTPDRDFILFWVGHTFATFGDAIAFIAFPLLVLQSTGSVAQMGLVTALLNIGRLAASLVAGSIVDRFERQLLLLLSALGAAMCYALIPAAWWLVGPSMPLLYVLAAPIGALGALIQVGGTAFLPDLVDSFHLTPANSRVQATGAVAFLAGPLIAGMLAARYNPAVAVALESFAYLCFLWLLLAVRTRPVRHASAAPRDAFAGLRFLWRDPLLRWVSPLNAAQVAILAGTMDLFIFRLNHELQQGPASLGLIFGGAALGAIVAGLLTPWLRARLGFGTCFLGGLFFEGLLLVGFGLTTSINVVIALGVGFIFADTIILITSQVVQQERTPTPLLGRVTAAYQVLVAVGSPLGAAATTAIAAHNGTSSVIIGLGGCITALAVLGVLTPARQRADARG